MANAILVLVLILFLSKVTFEFKVKYGFTTMTPPCNIHHFLYEIIPDTSLVKCAELCFSNSCGMCERFLWKDTTQKCKLHSTALNDDNDSTKTWGSLIFTRMIPECVAVGYDYDPETNTCLKYIKQIGTTWNDARAICQNDGGDLISIPTKQKWTFVSNYVQCIFTVWIGLQGTHWLSGDVYTPIAGITAQLNGDDADYLGDPDQNCGALYPEGNHQLQDESCNTRPKDAFVCEVIIS